MHLLYKSQRSQTKHIDGINLVRILRDTDESGDEMKTQKVATITFRCVGCKTKKEIPTDGIDAMQWCDTCFSPMLVERAKA